MTTTLVPSALAEAGREPPDPALARILGPPPVLASEDAEAYEALQDRVRAAMAPADVIEELWVRDVVDLTWEALRLRRLKAKLMAAAKPQALSVILAGLVTDARRRQLVDGWVAGNRRARSAVERTLDEAGLASYPAGPAITVVPSANVRTVFVTAIDGGRVEPHFLKLHYPRRLSRFTRRLRRPIIGLQLWVADELARIGAPVLPEVAGGVLGDDARQAWGYLVREWPAGSATPAMRSSQPSRTRSKAASTSTTSRPGRNASATKPKRSATRSAQSAARRHAQKRPSRHAENGAKNDARSGAKSAKNGASRSGTSGAKLRATSRDERARRAARAAEPCAAS